MPDVVINPQIIFASWGFFFAVMFSLMMKWWVASAIFWIEVPHVWRPGSSSSHLQPVPFRKVFEFHERQQVDEVQIQGPRWREVLGLAPQGGAPVC